MAHKAMDVYLNDHLAGARLGTDLAQQIQSKTAGTALGELMRGVAAEIEEDRDTLIDLMERMGTSKNPVKQATTWMTEKASRVKFSGLTSGESELGTFMALETLSLGVKGKQRMWEVLAEVAGQHPPLASVNLEALIGRARAQHAALEQERLVAGREALTGQAQTRT